MSQSHELVIEQGILSQTAQGNTHTAVDIPIQLRLGTVILLEIGDELLGCVGQAQKLREGAFVPVPEAPEDPVEAEEENAVIRTKVFRMKPMTPDEAILQMNLLGHDFFMFRDSVSEEVCVVYRRRDGAYGLIVPEK